MYRLLEVTLTDKESPAIYDAYADKTAMMADFETKTGQAMKADAFHAELLVAFDSVGNIYNQKLISKGEEYTLSPRMVFVQTKNGTETADQAKKADANTLEADYHIKKGSAMADNTISQIFIMGFDGKEISINDFWMRDEPIE